MRRGAILSFLIVHYVTDNHFVKLAYFLIFDNIIVHGCLNITFGFHSKCLVAFYMLLV